jgi:hypothetical protein
VIQENVLQITSCELVADAFFESCMKLYICNFSLSHVYIIAYQKSVLYSEQSCEISY